MTDSKSAQFLLICRSSPYSSSRMSAAIDLALTAATFEQDVYMLFIGEGVYNLLSDQKAHEAGAKNLSKAFSAFDLYGVKDVLVDEDDTLVPDESQFVIPVTKSSSHEIKKLIQNSDQVLVF